MQSEDARAMLQATQQLRTHLSGLITNHFGYALILNTAIWSFFGKAYFDSLSTLSGEQPAYLTLAAGISAFYLGFWRLYTHQLDRSIASLYPDLVLCEALMGVPARYGTSGYLIKDVRVLESVLLSQQWTPEQKATLVKELVSRRVMGWRGHLKFDVSVVILIVIMFAIVVIFFRTVPGLLNLAALSLITAGFLFGLVSLFGYHRDPTQTDIAEIIARI